MIEDINKTAIQRIKNFPLYQQYSEFFWENSFTTASNIKIYKNKILNGQFFIKKTVRHQKMMRNGKTPCS